MPEGHRGPLGAAVLLGTFSAWFITFAISFATDIFGSMASDIRGWLSRRQERRVNR